MQLKEIVIDSLDLKFEVVKLNIFYGCFVYYDLFYFLLLIATTFYKLYSEIFKIQFKIIFLLLYMFITIL